MPADTAGTYVYEISWAGFDPDGRIVRFQYAIDPPGDAGAETLWVSTRANRGTFVFRADSVGTGESIRARTFHTVAVVAWDDRGARSPVAYASFTATTVAPTVAILSPSPSALLSRELASAVRITWQGDDPDGVGSRSPAQYRWKLFSESGDLPREFVRLHPDSIRVRFAPSFADWDSLPGTATSVEIRNLIPSQSYMFVVVAIDRAGAYSPVFNMDTNMLDFTVRTTATLGPILTITSPVFTYTFPGGGFFVDPAFYVHGEFAADAPIPIAWSAKPASGSFIRGYRWAVDIAAIDDETPRADETADLHRWSRWQTSTSLVLPPVSPAGPSGSETHLFYLEAEDDLGFRSLGIVQYVAVRPTFSRDLLVVDDTWFARDHTGRAGCVAVPPGAWPSAAELDTFLFAVGDKPYRCYPAGTRSAPGVLAGYAYDTLTTHFTAPGALSLQFLGRYRHILWMCDPTSALSFQGDPATSLRPRPLLTDWCTPPNQDRLASWLLQGGSLWILGGGAALASLRPFDALHSPNNVFSSALGELAQGRFMYDEAHWQSEITALHSTRAVRSARAVPDSPDVPDYSLLPAVLVDKATAGDPLPPNRGDGVYSSSYVAEYLSRPNSIVELDSPDPATGTAVAALDTLYETAGGTAGDGHPVMTLYHGRQNGMVVFSGFPIWYFQRSQCIELVDFVLQRAWGLSRQPVAR